MWTKACEFSANVWVVICFYLNSKRRKENNCDDDAGNKNVWRTDLRDIENNVHAPSKYQISQLISVSNQVLLQPPTGKELKTYESFTSAPTMRLYCPFWRTGFENGAEKGKRDTKYHSVQGLRSLDFRPCSHWIKEWNFQTPSFFLGLSFLICNMRGMVQTDLGDLNKSP